MGLSEMGSCTKPRVKYDISYDLMTAKILMFTMNSAFFLSHSLSCGWEVHLERIQYKG